MDEVMRASQAATKEHSSAAPTISAAPTEEGPLSSVAVAKSTTATLLLSSGASLEHTPTEKSMELDYANNSTLTTPVPPAMTPQVIPSPMEAAVMTNVATPTTPEAGTSSSSFMANTVSEHWADIVSNKEKEASKMDEQVGKDKLFAEIQTWPKDYKFFQLKEKLIWTTNLLGHKQSAPFGETTLPAHAS
ncbi:hypothetical protein C0989_011293 [Termitomyces sp. Mn162]|nr:hypothetical protein C0989_011293 [Termitomyces sp. Mn162]